MSHSGHQDINSLTVQLHQNFVLDENILNRQFSNGTLVSDVFESGSTRTPSGLNSVGEAVTITSSGPNKRYNSKNKPYKTNENLNNRLIYDHVKSSMDPDEHHSYNNDMHQTKSLNEFVDKWNKICVFNLLRARKLFLTGDELHVDDPRDHIFTFIEKSDRPELYDRNGFSSNIKHTSSIIERCLSKTQLQSLENIFDTSCDDHGRFKIFNVDNDEKHENSTHHDKMLETGLPSLLPLYLFNCRIYLNILSWKIKLQLDENANHIKVKIDPNKNMIYCWCIHKTTKHSLNEVLQIYQLYNYLTTKIEFSSDDLKEEFQKISTDFIDLQNKISEFFSYYLKQLLKFIKLSCKIEHRWWKKYTPTGSQDFPKGFILDIPQTFIIQEFDFACKVSKVILNWNNKASEMVVDCFYNILYNYITYPTEAFEGIMEEFKRRIVSLHNDKSDEYSLATNLYNLEVQLTVRNQEYVQKESMRDKLIKDCGEQSKVLNEIQNGVNLIIDRAEFICKKFETRMESCIPLKLSQISYQEKRNNYKDTTYKNTPVMRDRLKKIEMEKLEEDFYLCQIYNIGDHDIYNCSTENDTKLINLPMILIPKEFMRYNSCSCHHDRISDNNNLKKFNRGMHYSDIIKTIQKIAGSLTGKDDASNTEECIAYPYLLLLKRSLFYYNFTPGIISRKTKKRLKLNNNYTQIVKKANNKRIKVQVRKTETVSNRNKVARNKSPFVMKQISENSSELISHLKDEKLNRYVDIITDNSEVFNFEFSNSDDESNLDYKYWNGHVVKIKGNFGIHDLNNLLIEKYNTLCQEEITEQKNNDNLAESDKTIATGTTQVNHHHNYNQDADALLVSADAVSLNVAKKVFKYYWDQNNTENVTILFPQDKGSSTKHIFEMVKDERPLNKSKTVPQNSNKFKHKDLLSATFYNEETHSNPDVYKKEINSLSNSSSKVSTSGFSTPKMNHTLLTGTGHLGNVINGVENMGTPMQTSTLKVYEDIILDRAKLPMIKLATSLAYCLDSCAKMLSKTIDKYCTILQDRNLSIYKNRRKSSTHANSSTPDKFEKNKKYYIEATNKSYQCIWDYLTKLLNFLPIKSMQVKLYKIYFDTVETWVTQTLTLNIYAPESDKNWEKLKHLNFGPQLYHLFLDNLLEILGEEIIPDSPIKTGRSSPNSLSKMSCYRIPGREKSRDILNLLENLNLYLEKVGSYLTDEVDRGQATIVDVQPFDGQDIDLRNDIFTSNGYRIMSTDEQEQSSGKSEKSEKPKRITAVASRANADYSDSSLSSSVEYPSQENTTYYEDSANEADQSSLNTEDGTEFSEEESEDSRDYIEVHSEKWYRKNYTFLDKVIRFEKLRNDLAAKNLKLGQVKPAEYNSDGKNESNTSEGDLNRSAWSQNDLNQAACNFSTLLFIESQNQLLGEGQFGKVYTGCATLKAPSQSSNHASTRSEDDQVIYVAVKCIDLKTRRRLSHKAIDEHHEINKMIQQVIMMKKFNHKHILTYYGMDRGLDTIKIFMECCKSTLDELIKQSITQKVSSQVNFQSNETTSADHLRDRQDGMVVRAYSTREISPSTKWITKPRQRNNKSESQTASQNSFQDRALKHILNRLDSTTTSQQTLVNESNHNLVCLNETTNEKCSSQKQFMISANVPIHDSPPHKKSDNALNEDYNNGLSAPQIKLFTHQLTSALAYLEGDRRNGKQEPAIIHRDLKPSNVFLVDEDTLKIGDFGSSMKVEDLQYLNDRIKKDKATFDEIRSGTTGKY